MSYESTDRKATERKLHETPMENLWFYYVLSCITTSHGIAVMWFLRVYWLLPLSIVDSIGKHRRILGPVNQLHFPKESFPYFNGLFFFSSTEIVDSLAEVILNQQTPANKTLQSFLLTKRSCQTWRTREFCWVIPGYEFAFLDDGHQWNEVSPLASALQERKRQRDLLYPSPHLKIYWSPNRKRKVWLIGFENDANQLGWIYPGG